MAVKLPDNDQRPFLRGAFDDGGLKAVLVRAVKSHGVWHVTRDATFYGDYLTPEAALSAAVKLAIAIEHGGGRAEVFFDPP
jgi:hypothetical protein